MTKAISYRALAALLASEDKDYTPVAEEALPTLNERLEIFLRALYGSGREFTAQERAVARARILDAMADDPTDESNKIDDSRVAPTNVHSDATSSRPGGQRQSLGARFAGLFGQLSSTLGALAAGPRARFVTASFAVLVLAGAAWGGAWFYAARTAESAIAVWIDREARSGRTYECGSQSIGGFPLRLEMRCTEPSAKIAFDQSTATAKAKEIRAAASILHPNSLSAKITGPVSVSEHNQPIISANWKSAQLGLRGSPSNLDGISIAMDGVQFYQGQISMQPLLTSDRLEVEAHLAPASANEMAVFNISVHLGEGLMPFDGPLPLQPFVADAAAVVNGIIDGEPKTFTAALREWQANSGTLEVKNARIQQGNAVALAQGSIRLNGNGNLEGSLGIGLAGPYVQFADTLMREGQRKNLAQSFQAPTQTRAIGAQREPAHPTGNTPLAARTPSVQSNPSDVAIRFVDGAVYLGTVIVAVIPPLY